MLNLPPIIKNLIRPWLTPIKDIVITVEPEEAMVTYSYLKNGKKESGTMKAQEVADQIKGILTV